MSLYRLRTRGDCLVLLGVCTLIAVFGVALLVYQAQPLPTRADAFTQVSGVLEEVVGKGSARQHAWARFRVVGDARTFENRSRGIHDAAQWWTVYRTKITFYVLNAPREAGTDEDPICAYALMVDDRPTRSLTSEIEAVNAGSKPWGAWIALCIAILGYVGAALACRRVSRTGAGV